MDFTKLSSWTSESRPVFLSPRNKNSPLAICRFAVAGRRRGLGRLAAAIAPMVFMPGAALAQAPAVAGVHNDASLTLPQVVEKLMQRNAERAVALGSYRNRRVYQLEYRGFPSSIHAEMVADMMYTAPGKKEFAVVSQSGSKLIVKRVLLRLLDSEREAQEPKNHAAIELNTQNYEFTALEYQHRADGCGYVLSVQPRTINKFLYRGRVWVNEQDFAVCRIEAEPAQNPSMWISKTQIRQTYQKIGDFWLPAENESVSSMRLDGRATLTIKYSNYEIPAGRAVAATESQPDAAGNH
jgi:hypothetical protein